MYEGLHKYMYEGVCVRACLWCVHMYTYVTHEHVIYLHTCICTHFTKSHTTTWWRQFHEFGACIHTYVHSSTTWMEITS